VAYWTVVTIGALFATAMCVAARLRPGPWTIVAARTTGLVLAADAASYVVAEALDRTWSPRTSLPLALCNVAVPVAAVACWWRAPLLVELTYFWGLAGTVQGLVTPDLGARFPQLVFFQYVAGHLGVVTAALLLAVGIRIAPRRAAVPRVLALTGAYTAAVGAIDGFTGANYMFLRRPPGEWTVLRLLGPWPWYVASAAGVAWASFVLLDLPFWFARRRSAAVPDVCRPSLARRGRPREATIGGVSRHARRQS